MLFVDSGCGRQEQYVAVPSKNHAQSASSLQVKIMNMCCS